MNRLLHILSLIALVLVSLVPSSRLAAIALSETPPPPTAACPKAIGSTLTPASTTAPPATPILTPEDLVATYFTANRERRYEDMITLYSDDSLAFFQLSRDVLLAGLRQDDFVGIRLLDFQLIQTDFLSDTQVVLTVMVRRHEADGRETAAPWKLIAVREGGSWKFTASHKKYGSLIDYRILTLPTQTKGNLTIQPRYLARYLGGLEFAYCVHNGGTQAVLWTWVNEVALTFAYQSGITCEVLGNTPPLTFQAGGTYPSLSTVVVTCSDKGFPTRLTFKYLRFANSMGLPADLGAGLSFTFNLP